MIYAMIPYAVAAALVAATLIDFRTGKIPNWFVYIFSALFVVMVAVSPDKVAMAWQFGFAVGAFALGLLMYTFVGFSAGAVKLLFGAALFMPMGRPGALIGILLLTIFGGGLLIQFTRNIFGSETSKWKILRERVTPLSLPVTATALIGMFVLQA